MRRNQRKVADRGWRVWRNVVGSFYLLSAVFNAAYTLPRAGDAETFEGYADGAWLPFLEDLMWDVFIPNATAFMVAVIVLEVVVGLMILATGDVVDLGVVASLLWVLGVMPFLAWPYLLVNVALIGLQGVVLLRRYDRAAWTRTRSGGVAEEARQLEMQR